ncbi:MAG: nuclear transport factor 2 family protein [Sneathiellales bacterium]|nr:nuclear transport factor 2 family protein [Sneathiellales bacterium]
MPDYPNALDQLLAAWNEQDPSVANEYLKQALSPDVRFVDPTADVRGLEGFEANMQHVKTKIPGAVYTRTSGVDCHHGFHRYHWAIHLEGKLVIEGFDVTEVDTSGRVLQVIGFFGEMPQL